MCCALVEQYCFDSFVCVGSEAAIGARACCAVRRCVARCSSRKGDQELRAERNRGSHDGSKN